ncbi:MAG: hypothetical protein EOO07_06705, partial [Chitinophagaceae bacterium]
MKEVKNPIFCSVALAFMLVAAPSVAWAKNIWVAKSGNDSNACTNAVSDACLTIQKGISLAVAGDTVNIARGKYIENSSTSSYTKKCAWLDNRLASLCVPQSGTATSPITIQAKLGDEGLVIIDSEGLRVGLHTLASDYLQIKGLAKRLLNRTLYVELLGPNGERMSKPDYEYISFITKARYMRQRGGLFVKVN